MAISIVNTTTAALTQASNVVSIPATSVNNTLVVSLVYDYPASSSTSINSLTDSQGAGAYVQVNSAAFSISGKVFAIALYYHDLIAAGITSVTVNLSTSDPISIKCVVYEMSGINHVTPVTTHTIDQRTANTTADVGTLITTSSSGAFYVYHAIRSIVQSLTLATSGATTDFSTSSSQSGSIFGHKITTGLSRTEITHGLSNATALLMATIFSPDPNAYTLTITDTVTNDDNLMNAEDIVTSVADSFSLSDFVDLIIAANARFRTLLDTLTTTDSLSLVSNFTRLLQETVILSDIVMCALAGNRTLLETIKVQDWIELKRSSDQWSS